MKTRIALSATCALLTQIWCIDASAVSSAELYTSASYQYGRFEASIRFAPGSGVVSSFFLWKNGSEVAGTFWNELDFEKVGADCHLETNPLYGDPEASYPRVASVAADLCGGFHTYRHEWTPEYIAWFVDDVEVRRETGATALAYAENATAGMQLRFNIWPGDASFGGVFDPSILPVYQYIDWVQYSSYADGAFTVDWREDFESGAIPAGWSFGTWGSPKNLSTHTPQNVGVVEGFAVLALTADDAIGIEGAAPNGPSPTGAGGTMGGGGTTGAMAGADSAGCACRSTQRAPNAGLGSLLLLGMSLAGVARRRRQRGPTSIMGG